MKYNNIYTVDWRKLARDLIKVELRQKRTMAFGYALVSPFAELHSRFLLFRKNVKYRLRINYQVCYLEAALNDRWDYSERRIRIVDAKEYNALPLFLKVENKPVRLFRKQEAIAQPLYTKSETAQFTVDFLVEVPASVPFDTIALRAFVQEHIVQSRTFKIQIV